MKSRVIHSILAAAALLSLAAPMAASTLSVSSNGTDSATCGSKPPCATINQAVANASAGDSIVVGPGRYGGATVDKALKVSSSTNGGAVINGTISLTGDGIVFGKKGKGFLITPGGSSSGIEVSADDVIVRGNFVSHCDKGIAVTGARAVVRDNSVDDCNVGVLVDSIGALVRGNLTSDINLRGMMLSTTRRVESSSVTSSRFANVSWHSGGLGIQAGVGDVT